MMKIALILLILPFSLCLSQQDGLADVFPLSIGNEWTYHSFSAWSYDPYNAIGDSGIVHFTVIDSIATPDSIRWVFREDHDWWHFIDRWYWQDPDIWWQVIDTIMFEIVEFNTGRHRLLRYEDEGSIWNSVFPWFPELTDTTAIYRYAEVDAEGVVRFETHDSYQWYVRLYDMTFKRDIGPVEVIQTPHAFVGSYTWASHSLLGALINAVSSDEPAGIPKDFLLHQNYPNPFNPGTTIEYELSRRTHILVTVYDVLGREITTLVDRVQDPGLHYVKLDGSRLPSGVYLYRMRVDGISETKKMLLMR
jgi:hypothetical protein